MWMPPYRREMPAESAASKYVAHSSLTSEDGPASNFNEPARTVQSSSPPGKYSLPVKPVSTSAAARLNVLCPEKYPANDGVTNVGAWYGSHSTAGIQRTPPICV